MSKDRQDSIADIVAEMRHVCHNPTLGVKTNREKSLEKSLKDMLLEYVCRIEAAHKREKIKFEFALDIQKNNVAKLCELLKEFANVLSDTKNYACFGCTIRGCPGEHECRYMKKYCLLIDKSREAIEAAKAEVEEEK